MTTLMSCSISRMPMPNSSRIARSSCRELGGLARIEPGGRLVEAEQHGLGAHRARDLEPALLAVGQTAGGPVGMLGEAGAVEPARARARPPRARLAGRRRSPARRRRCSRTRASARCAARRSGSRAPTSGRTGGCSGRCGRRRARAIRKPSICSSRSCSPSRMQGQPADGRLVEAGQAVEHRGLAGAVRADDRGDLAL